MDEQKEKLNDMDVRMNKNFTVLLNEINRKIDSALAQ